MKMDRGCTLPLLLSLHLLPGFYFTPASVPVTVVVSENDTVRLDCGGSGDSSDSVVVREWRKGFRNESVKLGSPIFTQTRTAEPTRKSTAREDMAVHVPSFSLVIGRAQTKDSGPYTCFIFSTERSTYNHTYLSVHVPPKIELTISRANETRNETVTMTTVTCRVERVLPALREFYMTWGEEDGRQTGNNTTNPDSTYRYSISQTFIESEDNRNMPVTCIAVRSSGRTEEIRGTVNKYVNSLSGGVSRQVAAAVGGTLAVVLVVIGAAAFTFYYMKHKKTEHARNYSGASVHFTTERSRYGGYDSAGQASSLAEVLGEREAEAGSGEHPMSRGSGPPDNRARLQTQPHLW